MKTKNSATFRSLIVVGALGALGTGASQATLTFTLTESGGGVNYEMSGSIDTAALGGFLGAYSMDERFCAPSSGGIGTGNTSYDVYSINATEWTVFGTGGVFYWTGTSGSVVALFSNPAIGLSHDYVSGAPMSSSGWKSFSSFTSLGITPGSYTTTFSNAGHTDHVTVDVVPEAQGALLATLGLGASLLRRKRRATA